MKLNKGFEKTPLHYFHEVSHTALMDLCGHTAVV